MPTFGFNLFATGGMVVYGELQATSLEAAATTVWADIESTGSAVLDLAPYEVGRSLAGRVNKSQITGFYIQPQG